MIGGGSSALSSATYCNYAKICGFQRLRPYRNPTTTEGAADACPSISPSCSNRYGQNGQTGRSLFIRKSGNHMHSWQALGTTIRRGSPHQCSGNGPIHGRVAGKARALAPAVTEDEELEEAKLNLFSAMLETGRGVGASAEQRVEIEEALVGVEKFDAGKTLGLDKLDGTWLLQYTTAPDVVQILRASETPLFKVGQIFQKFECTGRTDGGVVRNVVRWSVPGFLQDDDGATLVVTAKFSVVSPRSIALSFQEAQLGQVAISEGLQAFLAPAFLPRADLNLKVLQYLRTLVVRVPLTRSSNQANQATNTTGPPTATWYYLTYLDDDLLAGRALGSGGIFIFTRTQQLQLN